MHMFQTGIIRKVNVPDEELKNDISDLDRIFYWGQNDFQPDGTRVSVSAGDVIRFQGKRYLVKFLGYEEIGNEQLTTEPTELLRRIMKNDTYFNAPKKK